MPTATGNATAKLIRWESTDVSVRYFNVYRREDNVTASITTSDIVAKVGFGANHFTDPVIENKPYWYWVKAISWAGHSSAFSNTITALGSTMIMSEPTGFPNRTCSTITWTNATRTLSISPSGTSFSYYNGGIKAVVTAAKTLQVNNTSNLSFIYFDDTAGTLAHTSSFSSAQLATLIETKALVAAVYYNTAGSTAYFGDERHGILMPGAVHAYEHFTTGFVLVSGYGINTITSDASGAIDAHAQWGVDAGTSLDEDIPSTASAVVPATGMPYLYRSGANGDWLRTTNAGFSFPVGATPRAQWNEWTGATWQLTEVTSGNLVLSHVFCSNDKDYPTFTIVGQAEYTTVALARAGADTEIASLQLGNLPTKEFHPVATVILQSANAYANSVNTRVRSDGSGNDYIDWRFQNLTPGAGPSDHGSLSGLSDDDHAQYLLLAGRAGQTIDDNIVICGTTTINDALSVNAATNISGALTVDGASILKNTLTVSGVVTINNNIAVTGTATVYGATKINNTLDVTAASTFGQSVTILSAMHSLFVEMTASADPPAPIVGGMLRLYAKDTAGSTVLCSIGTAGTVTQYGAGGGASALNDLTDVDTAGVAEGNVLIYSTSGTWKPGAASGGGYKIYIEEGGVNKIDTDGQNAQLNFDGNDFDVTIVSGESATVSLASALVFDGGITVNGGLAVSGNVTVSGDTSLNGNLTVSGTSTLIGAATLRGTLTVSGVTTLNNNLAVTGTATIDGATKINNTLQVTGAVTLGSTLTVSGALTLNAAANISGALTVDGATVLKNTLAVSGVLTCNNNIAVTGTATIDGATKINNTLQVTGATTLGSTLTVSGLATFNNNLNVTGTATIDGATKINNTLQVTGATTIGSTLTVSGLATFNNNLNVTGTATIDGATKINNTLQVTGATTFGSTLTVSGALTVNDNAKISGTLTVDSSTILKGTLTVSGITTINQNANINGVLSTSGAVTYINSDIGMQVDKALTICGICTCNSNVNITGSLTTYGAAKINSTLQVTGATTLGSTLTVSGLLTLNAAANISGALTVDAATVLKNTLAVSGTTTINNELKVTSYVTIGDYARAQESLSVQRNFTNQATDHRALTVVNFYAPAGNNVAAYKATGIGGYMRMENANYGAAYTIYGLDFSPYVFNVTGGSSTYVTSYGIRTGGSGGFQGTFNALVACGLDVGMVFQAGGDYLCNVNATTGYGIFIEDGAGLGGTKTIGTAYQLYINGIASTTVEANKWLIYANDGKNYFRSNIASAAGEVLTLHQDNASGAIGCLELIQDDDSYDFIKFTATAGAGTGYSVNTTERNTFNCMIAINVNGTIRWLKAYA